MSNSLLLQVLLRGVCAVYAVAFLCAYHQNTALLGNQGLQPIDVYLDNVAAHFHVHRDSIRDTGVFGCFVKWVCGDGASEFQAFRAAPSFLWWVQPSELDTATETASLLGVIVSMLVVCTGRSNMLLMLLLWGLYLSIVSTGQSFYSFGWESQLLETGFIAVLLCRVVSLTPLPHVPLVVVYAYRWLMFRVMFGAGMIKLRGDSCWRDLSCMEYFYETQPNPNPFSALFHSTTASHHRREVWGNHFVELVAPFFLLLPQPAAAIGGVCHIAFMTAIIASGNLSFLNWLTMVPAAASFSEQQLNMMAAVLRRRCRTARTTCSCPPQRSVSDAVRLVLHAAYALTVVWLSIPVVDNMLNASQIMNSSFDWLRLVNTYGNFGSVTRERHEVIVEGRSALTPNVWREYEFACKPGNVFRRPCLVSPYHYRLDWLMWFAAFQRIEHNPWLLHLALKLMTAHTDEQARDILNALGVEDPFAGTTDHPTHIRMTLVRYSFHKSHMNDWSRSLRGTMSSLVTGNRTLSMPYWRRHRQRAAYLDAVGKDELNRVVERWLGRPNRRRKAAA